MTTATLTQLKTLVEQVVRPVRASNTRKRQMREELLAYVTDAYNEEIAKGGDEPSALERTCQRFGSPTELTAEIETESAAPRVLVVAWLDRLVAFRPGESTLRRATRFSLIMFVVFGAICLSFFIPQGRLYDWPLIVSAPVMVFCTTFLMHWMRQALCGPTGPRWKRVALVSLAAWLFVPTLTLAFCWFYTRDLSEAFAAFRFLLVPGALAPIGLIGIAPVMAQELRRAEEWDGLAIPEQKC